MRETAHSSPALVNTICAAVPRPTVYLLGATLAVAACLHGWPATRWTDQKLLWPFHLVVTAWCAWLALRSCRRPGRDVVRAWLPPACVWAYVVVSLLSVAAAQNPARAASAAVKTALSLIGTYTLVRAMARAHPGARPLLWALAFGVTGVLIHATVQMAQGQEPVGMFASPLKLGSFLAMTVTLSASYLAAQGRVGLSIWAAMLAAGGLLVSGSLWAWVGIVAGLAAAAAADAKARAWLAGAMIAAAAAMGWLASCDNHHRLIDDAQWREDGGQDLRQRYIEWQALINLLKEHPAAGAGVGCLNDRRSEYYLRLPKNNTIAAFDQNGYLAAAAETGLPGLAAMCWVLGEYLRKGWRRRRDPVARAAWVGLVAAAIAQVGSSLTFSGILVVFAILLALIDGSEQEVTHAPA